MSAIPFKEGDSIIWDSGFGFELGSFIADADTIMYDTYKVNLVTGVVQGPTLKPKTEIRPYSAELVNELSKKYHDK